MEILEFRSTIFKNKDFMTGGTDWRGKIINLKMDQKKLSNPIREKKDRQEIQQIFSVSSWKIFSSLTHAKLMFQKERRMRENT